MKHTPTLDATPLLRALESAWYAMEKHAPGQCGREIRTAAETLARFKGLNIEKQEQTLETILHNATIALREFHLYGQKMRKDGLGFEPSIEMTVPALIEMLTLYYSERFPKNTLP